MGQYWKVVNLDKREYVSPHRLGTGLKLWEQLANHPGTGAALIVLCAAMPEPRGGGDFDLAENWHGPERDVMGKHPISPGPMPEAYPAIAKRTIGRWAGDRIALVGDYAEDTDLRGPLPAPASHIYGLCIRPEDVDPEDPPQGSPFTDVSDDVAAVIEHELGGRYTGERGWREWTSREVIEENERKLAGIREAGETTVVKTSDATVRITDHRKKG